ncbi:MAG TPA: hypothetical protein VF688_02035 [Allosphingosinicella sp.]|jgi:hypothetical protein
MGLGAIITGGENFTVLEDIASSVIEARVEMELSKPTKFAIRFQDDICEGEPVVAGHDALQAEQMIGIFVSAGEALHCLVHGPITRVRSSRMLGGFGSWYEIHGEDRRVLLSRVGVEASWPMKASHAAAGILDSYHFDYEVQETRKNYDEQHPLNQRATDLAFLEDIARRNAMEFWIDYHIAPQPPSATTIDCGPMLMLKTSPHVDNGAAAVPGPPVLMLNGNYAINVSPPPDQCAKVTKFDVRIDFERPNSAQGFAQSRSGETVDNQGGSEQAATTPGSQTLPEISGVVRRTIVDPTPDPDEHYLAQQAMLTEAAWFVEVDCSSTLEMLDFVVKPHMIVAVQYADSRLSGNYQVKSATHVINATDHFMDFKLRANGLPAPPAGSPL